MTFITALLCIHKLAGSSTVYALLALHNTRYIQPSNLPFFWQQKDPMNIETQRDIFCMPVFHSLPRIHKKRKKNDTTLYRHQGNHLKENFSYFVKKPETKVDLNKVILYLFSVISLSPSLIQKRFIDSFYLLRGHSITT